MPGCAGAELSGLPKVDQIRIEGPEDASATVTHQHVCSAATSGVSVMTVVSDLDNSTHDKF